MVWPPPLGIFDTLLLPVPSMHFSNIMLIPLIGRSCGMEGVRILVWHGCSWGSIADQVFEVTLVWHRDPMGISQHQCFAIRYLIVDGSVVRRIAILSCLNDSSSSRANKYSQMYNRSSGGRMPKHPSKNVDSMASERCENNSLLRLSKLWYMGVRRLNRRTDDVRAVFAVFRDVGNIFQKMIDCWMNKR